MLPLFRGARGANWGAPLALVALAAVAFAAAYASSLRNSADGNAAGDGGVPGGTVAFSDTFAPEKGPDGQAWTWMGDFAIMSATGEGRYWLGVKASSLRRSRLLEFEDATGAKPITVKIGVAPRVYVLGPLSLSDSLRLGMSPRPGASRAGRRDRRKLAVFLSQPRLFRNPLAAFPGRGFWTTETTSTGLPFNWLKDTGEIVVRAASPLQLVVPSNVYPARRVWLTFVAVSSGVQRTLSVRLGGFSATVRVPKLGPDSDGRRFTLGPIKLRGGAATVTVSARPGAKSVGADVRPLSVRLSELEALPFPRRPE